MVKIDHTSIDKSLQRQTAAKVIDLVEDKIRGLHPQVEELASTWIPEAADEPPNTLIYGIDYYDLEDELTNILVENFIRKGKRR